MTPLMIQMMLWFYYSPEPWPNWYSAQQDAAEYFVRENLIEPTGGHNDYRLTKRGTLYVESLMALTPPPLILTLATPTDDELPVMDAAQ